MLQCHTIRKHIVAVAQGQAQSIINMENALILFRIQTENFRLLYWRTSSFFDDLVAPTLFYQ